jgi:hypothetical protein
MDDRESAESGRSQRAAAPRKSAAHSPAAVLPLQRQLYRSLRDRIRRSSGPTSAQDRLRLELLAGLLAQIVLADQWLAAQSHPLLRDVRTGAVHDLVDRRVRWTVQAARLVDKLPGALGHGEADDLPALASRLRRTAGS